MKKGSKKEKEPISEPVKPVFKDMHKPVEPLRVIAVIPARGGSKGIENKNITDVGGRILIDWSIRAAKNAQLDLIISTDSVQYKDKIDLLYPKENYCPFIRDKRLATDSASSIDVILDAIDYLEAHGKFYDIVVLLEPTNPVRETTDITIPLAHFKNQTKYDSLVSVVCAPEHHPLLSLEGRQLQSAPEGMLIGKPHGGRQDSVGHPRRQSLDAAYYMNGGLYIAWIDKLRKNKMFDVDPCLLWVLPKIKSIEIDEPNDIPLVATCLKLIQK
jgi:CMP-N-acetylneuraminic acid synthetase